MLGRGSAAGAAALPQMLHRWRCLRLPLLTLAWWVRWLMRQPWSACSAAGQGGLRRFLGHKGAQAAQLTTRRWQWRLCGERMLRHPAQPRLASPPPRPQCRRSQGTMMEECTMLPTKSFSALSLEKDWWPQSWPTTNSAQNMVPCAARAGGELEELLAQSRTLLGQSARACCGKSLPGSSLRSPSQQAVRVRVHPPGRTSTGARAGGCRCGRRQWPGRPQRPHPGPGRLRWVKGGGAKVGAQRG